MKILSKVAVYPAGNTISAGHFIMRRPKLVFSQAILGAALVAALILSLPNAPADAVAPDREDWFVRCERAMAELEAQAQGRTSSSFANASINRRTLSACAEHGFRPGPGAVR